MNKGGINYIVNIIYVYYIIDQKSIRKHLEYFRDACGVDGRESLICAYTDSKKMAKSYESTRQMDKLYRKKIELTDHEYEIFKDHYEDFLIVEKNLIYGESNKAIKVTLTRSEYYSCTDYMRECIELDIEKMIKIDWRIFGKEIQSALKSIKYAYEFDTINSESFPSHPLFPDISYSYRYEDASTKYINRYGYRNELLYFIYSYNDILRSDILEVIA